jgi:hypothetical protein
VIPIRFPEPIRLLVGSGDLSVISAGKRWNFAKRPQTEHTEIQPHDGVRTWEKVGSDIAPPCQSHAEAPAANQICFSRLSAAMNQPLHAAAADGEGLPGAHPMCRSSRATGPRRMGQGGGHPPRVVAGWNCSQRGVSGNDVTSGRAAVSRKNLEKAHARQPFSSRGARPGRAHVPGGLLAPRETRRQCEAPPPFAAARPSRSRLAASRSPAPPRRP